MSYKRNFFRDRFTFSLRGMTATASFFITPIVADDRINRAWDEKLGAREQGRPENASAGDVAGESLRPTWSRSMG